MNWESRTLVKILVVAVVATCLLVLAIEVKVYMDEAEDMAVRLEQVTRELDSVRQTLAETRDTIKEYSAVASWYGPGFHGRLAADGSTYDQSAYTIAHKTLPFGTIVVLEYRGRRAPAIVTDRGPYIDGRDFDLSLGLAKRLGLVTKGVDEIKVYQLDIER